jgi:ankyrin repeat protein
MYAASEDSAEMVNLLINVKADINGRDKDGLTALFQSSISGKSNAVLALLNRGADPNILDKDGNSVLSWTRSEQRGAISAVTYPGTPSDLKKRNKILVKAYRVIVDALRKHGAVEAGEYKQ